MTAPERKEAEKVEHPLFARVYMRMKSGDRDQAEDEHRERLLAGLSGQVIEVGAGNGLNFKLYPAAVEKVLAVEPEPLLREAAVKEAARAPVEVEVVDGVAGSLPAADSSQDAAIASLVLCSVSDQGRALAELARVLRPGGELRFYEHVISTKRVPAALQRFADATFWPRVGGGCHMARDTTAAIERTERFTFSPGPPVPRMPHIIGVARRG